MQSVSSRIWTRVAVSISYDDNDYTTGTSTEECWWWGQQCSMKYYTVRINACIVIVAKYAIKRLSVLKMETSLLQEVDNYFSLNCKLGENQTPALGNYQKELG